MEKKQQNLIFSYFTMNSFSQWLISTLLTLFSIYKKPLILKPVFRLKNTKDMIDIHFMTYYYNFSLFLVSKLLQRISKVECHKMFINLAIYSTAHETLRNSSFSCHFMPFIPINLLPGIKYHLLQKNQKQGNNFLRL